MEVLKIKAYQLFANYRKPMSYNFVDTYPLPPLSTVKGWFHSVIGAKEYIPISMSIQGVSSSLTYDVQTLIKFNRIRRNQNQIILEAFNKAYTASPTYVANLYDVELIIYIFSDKKYLNKFKENIFHSKYPHLGRNEDLIRIDLINIITLENKTFSGMRDYHDINYGIYLNKTKAEELGVSGINYRMSFKYEIVGNLRNFSKIDVVYADNNQVTNGCVWYDMHDLRIVDFIGDYVE